MSDEAGEGQRAPKVDLTAIRDLHERSELQTAKEEAIVQWLVTTTPDIEPPPYFLEDTFAYLDRHLGPTSK